MAPSAPVPWELAYGPASVVVQDQGRLLNTISVEIRPSRPGVFTVTHINGTLADSAHPAHAGNIGGLSSQDNSFIALKN